MLIFYGRELSVLSTRYIYIMIKTAEPQLSIFHNIRVLLAEDDEVSEQYLLILLNRLGAEVEVVRRGDEVRAKLEEQTFQMLIIDLHLHPINSLQLVKEIRTDIGKNLAIVGISTADLGGRAMGVGIDQVLRKPLESRVIIASLEQALLKQIQSV